MYVGHRGPTGFVSVGTGLWDEEVPVVEEVPVMEEARVVEEVPVVEEEMPVVEEEVTVVEEVGEERVVVEDIEEAVLVVEEVGAGLRVLVPELPPVPVAVFAVLLETVIVEVDPVDADVEVIVEVVVEFALANTIWGAEFPVTMMAASDRSLAPTLTAPILLLSKHWSLDRVMSKVTATQISEAAPELRVLQAAIHSAKFDPLTLTRSLPVSAVLQRMRYPPLTVRSNGDLSKQFGAPVEVA